MYGIPGIGSLAIESAFNRDYAIVQGVSLTIISSFILITFTFDILCGLIDPRLRFSSSSKNAI